MSEPNEETRDELIDRMEKQLKAARKALKDAPDDDPRRADLAHAERDFAAFVTPSAPDGFRERKVRSKGWLKEAMGSGSVFDPDKPAPTPIERQLGDLIVAVPTARATLKALTPE